MGECRLVIECREGNMKILLISSSPRAGKSQTFLLAKEVLRGCASKAVESDIIQMGGLTVGFCRHCEACHKKILSCPIKDDVHIVLRKMLEADGIVLASPNYINQVTASMKALFDRSSHFIHCMRLLGKYIAGVVSSGSGQDEDVLDYIRFYGHVCGAQYAGGVSSRAPVSKEKMEEAFRLGERLALDVKEKKTFPEQRGVIEERKAYFGKIINMRKHEWLEEYRYWQDRDWL